MKFKHYLAFALLSLFIYLISNASAQNGQVRTYYIAADEVLWDYAPSNRNLMQDRPFNDSELVFVGQSENSIGAVYIKAVYQEYTDASFTELKPIPVEWEHKGLLGPILRAEVGDTIKVVFRNNATRPYSMHPHGVLYSKASEGANYNDNSTETKDVVQPGETYTYLWDVPESAGPGPNDGSSLVWLYHSHLNEPVDTYSGLIGAFVITAKGKAKADGSPMDIDREFISLFHIYNENKTWYLEENIKEFIGAEAEIDVEDEEFEESNLMHAMNGYVFGNMPLMTAKRGEKVRWYILGMGTEVDVHTAHWHGNTLLNAGQRTDVVGILPAEMFTLDMVAANKGIWMFHCHVNDHIEAGMMARYEVID